MTSSNTATTLFLDNGDQVVKLQSGTANVFKAKPGAEYRVVDNADRGSAELAPNVVVTRIGDDLVMNYPDGVKVVIANYFVVCSDGGCEVTLPRKGRSKGQRLDEDEEGEVINGDTTLLLVEGDSTAVMDIVRGDAGLTAAVAGAVGDNNDEGGSVGLHLGGLLAILGVGAGIVIYNAVKDDDSGPAIQFNPTNDPAAVNVSVLENAPITTVVYDADAMFNGMAADADLTYTLSGTDVAAFAIDAATGEVTLLASADFETQTSYSISVTATNTTSMEEATQEVVVGVTDVPLAIEGIVTAGPVVAGHGLIATAYTAAGVELGSAPLNDDGTFSIASNDETYRGLVLVRIHDTTAGPDYAHEGSGNNEDLSVDLRGIGEVGQDGTIRVNVNIATEIAVRQLLGDTGGDAGTAPVSLGASTADDATTHYSNVIRAFGLPEGIDLGSVDPHPVNSPGFADATPEAQALGRLLAAFAAAEVSGSAQTTDEVLRELVEGSAGGSLDQTLLTALQTAAALADTVASNAGGTAAALGTATAASITAVALSADSGSNATDFITNVTAQTVTATLGEALTGDQALFGSVDGGATWVDISSSVSATAVSWTATLLASADSQRILLAVTDDGAAPAADSSNVSGRVAAQSYQIDTLAPVLVTTNLNADENATAVGSLSVTEINGIAATGGYTLGGTDAALFAISDAGVLSFNAAQNFEAAGDSDSNGVYNLTVAVTDAVGNTSAAQAFTVTLANVNEAPTVGTAIVDSTAIVDQAFSLDVSNSFTDPDAGDTRTYTATGLPTGLTISAAGVISGTATTGAAASNVVVTATDAGGLTVTDTFALTVISAPTITGIALSGGAAVARSGDTLTFVVTLTEAVTVAGGMPTITLSVNGGPVTAAYASGSGSNALTFTTTAPSGDGNAVELVAIDLAGATITGDVSGQALITTIAVRPTTSDLTLDNTAPVLAVTSISVDENATAVGTLSVTEANALPATGGYTLGGTDAALFTLTDAGVLSLNTAQNFEAPGDNGANGAYDLTVVLTDSAGNASTAQALTVNLQNVNEAPTVGTAIVDSTAIANQAFTLNVSSSFSDPDAGDTLTYTATGLPAGLSISAAGVISGAATAALAATDIVVTATDAGGLAVTDTFALTVVAAPVASSTVDEVTNLDVRSPIVLTFSEAVTANTGNIVIRDLNTGGAGWKNDATDNTQTIDVTDTSLVTISGNTVTINPTFDLDLATNYEITIAADAFTGSTSMQGSVAVAAGELTFTTVTPATDAVGAVSQIQAAGTDALVASNYWIDGHQSDPSAPAIQVDAAANAIAVAYSLQNTGVVNEAGHISLNGTTDTSDIIYGDDPNSGLVANTNRDFGWTSGTKSIGNNAGGLSAATVYADQTSSTTIFSDATLLSEGAGAVIYG